MLYAGRAPLGDFCMLTAMCGHFRPIVFGALYEVCSIALAFPGLSVYVSMSYGVFESACSHLCHSLRSGMYALRRSLLASVERFFCALSFVVVFSIVVNSYRFCFSLII